MRFQKKIKKFIFHLKSFQPTPIIATTVSVLDTFYFETIKLTYLIYLLTYLRRTYYGITSFTRPCDY